MKSNTQSRNLRLPSELIERITRLATSERRTWANMVRVILEDGVRRRRVRTREDENTPVESESYDATGPV